MPKLWADKMFLKKKKQALITKEEKEKEYSNLCWNTNEENVAVHDFHSWIAGDINIFAYGSCIAVPCKERDLQPWASVLPQLPALMEPQEPGPGFVYPAKQWPGRDSHSWSFTAL